MICHPRQTGTPIPGGVRGWHLSSHCQRTQTHQLRFTQNVISSTITMNDPVAASSVHLSAEWHVPMLGHPWHLRLALPSWTTLQSNPGHRHKWALGSPWPGSCAALSTCNPSRQHWDHHTKLGGRTNGNSSSTHLLQPAHTVKQCTYPVKQGWC